MTTEVTDLGSSVAASHGEMHSKLDRLLARCDDPKTSIDSSRPLGDMPSVAEFAQTLDSRLGLAKPISAMPVFVQRQLVPCSELLQSNQITLTGVEISRWPYNR